MQDRNVTRRNLLKGFAALSASGATMFMAGCGGSSDSGSSAGGTADTITFAQGADPRGLDPAYCDDGESAKIMENIYENLLTYEDDSNELKNVLATDYQMSDDGLEYTFTLQEGVTFHDGAAFNAEAVKKSIDRQLEGSGRTEDMTYASFVFGEGDNPGAVKSVEVVDEYTVKITIADASTPFLKNMAMILGAPIVSPTAIDEWENDSSYIMTNPSGTGPYKFVAWNEAENVILQANEDYWGEAPKTQNIIFSFITENASRVTALNNGEVDIIDGIDATVVDEITNGGNSVFSEDGMNINYMAFNCTENSVCQDQAVRVAVAKAVNVEEMVNSLYGDYASVANSILPLWMASYDEDIVQTAYDPDAAQAELAELGVTELTCITYSNVRPYNTVGGQTLAEAIQGYLAKVGVTLNITPYDWTTYKQKTTTDPWDVCFYGWVGDNGDPDNFLNLLADSTPTMNIAQFDDEEYKSLIAQGVNTPDGEERDEIYHQCEQIVAEKQPWLLISHSKNLAGYNPNVSGFVIHPTGVVRLWNAVKAQ